MNGFDVVLLLVLLAFLAIGALRGMVREVLSLAVWIVAAVIGWLLADSLESSLKGLFDDRNTRRVLAFIGLFAVSWVIGGIGAYFLNRAFTGMRSLRTTNLVLGGVIGTARGVMLIVIVFLFAALTSLPQRPWWKDSAIAPVFERVVVSIGQYLPRDIARHIRFS
ncbi:MAG: CvpA family protein [Pseudomonadota bacterium]